MMIDFENTFDFDDIFATPIDEDNGLPQMSARKIKLQTKIRFQNKMKRQKVENLIDEFPKSGEALHVVSNGSFDYFTLVPTIIDRMGGLPVEDFWFSTWTMSNNNVNQILDLFDKGLLKNIHAFTGLYFKKREMRVYNDFYHGIRKRKQFLFANENHAKVTLMKIQDDYFVIEGSANFTANPRIEQFVINNSKELFDFHKDWMMTLLKNIKTDVE